MARPRPTQESLDALFKGVVRVRVIQGGVTWNRALGKSVLAELGAADIPRLKFLTWPRDF